VIVDVTTAISNLILLEDMTGTAIAKTKALRQWIQRVQSSHTAFACLLNDGAIGPIHSILRETTD